MPIIIHAAGLVKHYGKERAVDEVDLEVHTGEVFGLLGPNGAGKTTLISLLTGILTPDQGTAKICGHDLRTELTQIKSKVSLVPQEIALYQELSAMDNLKFFARLYHLSTREEKKRIEEVLEVVQLKEWSKKKVANYSGGMKRRLNLAIGLLNHPWIIFLDEPTVGVDPQSRNHIFESIRHLVTEMKLTVFYTTHYMEEAQTLCNRVAIYDHGKVVALGTPEELISGNGAIYIEVEINALPEQILSQILKLPSVKQAEYSAGILTVTLCDLVQGTVETLSLLQTNEIAVVSMRVQEQNLEQVFLKLTGKALREEYRERSGKRQL